MTTGQAYQPREQAVRRASAEREAPLMAMSHTGAGPRGRSMPAVPASAPVQRMPDWFDTLVGMARANPLGAALTVGAGAATILAYYYWHRKPKTVTKPPVLAETEPDWHTLEGVAKEINVDPEVLRTQLEQGVGDITLSDIYKKGFDPSKDMITGLVPAAILADLPESPAAKVETLFQRINQYRFNYTGIYESGGSSFLSGNGDCLSLAERFRLAAKAAGIDVGIESDEVAMVVASHAIHGRNTVANLDGTPRWFFHDHHWAVYNGTKYDLLFMDHQTPQAGHRTAQDVKHNGVSYDTFEGDIAVIHSGEFNKLTVALTPGRVGRAMPVSAVHDFIDTNKKD